MSLIVNWIFMQNANAWQWFYLIIDYLDSLYVTMTQLITHTHRHLVIWKRQRKQKKNFSPFLQPDLISIQLLIVVCPLLLSEYRFEEKKNIFFSFSNIPHTAWIIVENMKAIDLDDDDDEEINRKKKQLNITTI